MLPISLKRFFWDTKFEEINPESNKSYVISRLLELGDEVAVKWLEKSYSLTDLQHIVRTAKSLSPKSRNYWNMRYAIS